MAKAFYKLGQLIEFKRVHSDVKTLEPERARVIGVLQTEAGYSYQLKDGTFIAQSEVLRAYREERQVVRKTKTRVATPKKVQTTLTPKTPEKELHV